MITVIDLWRYNIYGSKGFGQNKETRNIVSEMTCEKWALS